MQTNYPHHFAVSRKVIAKISPAYFFTACYRCDHDAGWALPVNLRLLFCGFALTFDFFIDIRNGLCLRFALKGALAVTKRTYAPKIAKHPYLKHVVANRPGGYKTIDVLHTDDLPRMIGRINLLSAQLRVQYELLAMHKATELDVVGLEKLEASLSGMERGINVIADCVQQWRAHEFPDDIEGAD